MSVTTPLRLALAGLAAMLTLACAPAARAQEPSANSIAMANEIIDIKGSMTLFEPLIPGVVEQSKNTLLQMNPNMFKDLTDVAATLRKEYAPRLSALRQDIVKLYAAALHRAGIEGDAHVLQVADRQEASHRRADLRRAHHDDGAGLGDQAERGSATAFPCRNAQARPCALIARTAAVASR